MTDKEYQNEETLRRLYHEEKLDQTEIAEEYDVAKSTICYHMRKHGIETRDNIEIQRSRERATPAPLQQKDGYLRWSDQYGREKGWKKDVHHKNEMKLDNRPENLETMTRSEHTSLHNSRRAKPAKSLV